MVPMVTAPVFTWTGFYVGGNVGYSWGDWNRAGLAGGTGISKPSVDGWLLGIQGGLMVFLRSWIRIYLPPDSSSLEDGN